MPISLHQSRAWEFQVIRFEGRITFEGLAPLGVLHEQRPDLARADVIHIVNRDTDMSALTREHMDLARAHYMAVQKKLDFYMVRRAAWVCPGAGAHELIGYLLAGRNSRDGQSTEVRLVSDLADIAPLFSKEEIQSVADWSSLTEIVRIN